MEKADKSIKDAQDVIRDLSIMLGETDSNRAGRRAAKARMRSHIKSAKKKVRGKKDA